MYVASLLVQEGGSFVLFAYVSALLLFRYWWLGTSLLCIWFTKFAQPGRCTLLETRTEDASSSHCSLVQAELSSMLLFAQKYYCLIPGLANVVASRTDIGV